MLSDALELASPGIAMHQTKTAFIAFRIAERLGFAPAHRRELVWAALLHDVGALSPEEKIELHSGNPRHIERHCRNGRVVLSRVPLMERVAEVVGRHHDAWTGGGAPDETALDASIIHLADVVEIEIDRSGYILFQMEELRRRVREQRGGEYAPDAADAFHEISTTEEFWLELASPRLPTRMAMEQHLMDHRCPMNELVGVSRLARDIIDFRSTFTATHSSGVAAVASAIGALLGFSREECLSLEIAGNLHDIGKMAVSNAILLKPGPLDATERAIMRQHPWHTAVVLARAGLPVETVEAAGWHHERLDGSGYPRRAKAADTGLHARVMGVADVFTALAEERPYRGAMRGEEVRRILDSMAHRGALEPLVVGLIQDNFEAVVEAMRAAQTAAAAFYHAVVPDAA